MLLRGLIAGAIGVVAMNLSSETEMHWRQRPPSTSPGRAVVRLLQLVGGPDVTGRALAVLSSWVHYVYGIAWGLVLWVLMDPALGGLGVAAALPAFLGIVWGAEQVHLPLLGIAPPSWRWGVREVLIDLWHHAVYASGAVGGWVLVGVVADQLTGGATGR